MDGKLTEEYELWGLKINMFKAEYLCVKQEVANLDLEEKIKSCKTFKHLGSIIHRNDACSRDIETNIPRRKQVTEIQLD